MNFVRTYFLFFLLCSISNPTPLKSQEFPQDLQDQIIEVKNQILVEGYEITSIGRTWLGRILIKASNGSIEREIVVNRGSGEIIHDIRKRLPSPEFKKNVNKNEKNNIGSSDIKKHINTKNKNKPSKSDNPKNSKKLDKLNEIFQNKKALISLGG